jgi:hypothetical protein
VTESLSATFIIPAVQCFFCVFCIIRFVVVTASRQYRKVGALSGNFQTKTELTALSVAGRFRPNAPALGFH